MRASSRAERLLDEAPAYREAFARRARFLPWVY